MKNTQKKLKAKHFRYLSKEIIKDPKGYIERFFIQNIDFEAWQNEIKLITMYSCYPEMFRRRTYIDASSYCKDLIQQVEVAYVIFVKCGIKKKKSISFFKCMSDYFNYEDNRLTYNGDKNPYYQLSLFFSYMSLTEWYKILDDFWIYMAIDENEYGDRFGDRIIIIQELLLRLAYALHTIYKNGELILADSHEDQDTEGEIKE